MQEVSYDSSRGGISVITEKSDITTSYLLIQRAKSKDSGTYTCEPSNAKPSNISVHILNGNLIYNIFMSKTKSFHDECLHDGWMKVNNST